MIEYKEAVSLGNGNEKVILTDNGDIIVDGPVMPYLVGQIWCITTLRSEEKRGFFVIRSS